MAAKEDRARARMTHPHQILVLQESSPDILKRRWRLWDGTEPLKRA